MTRQLALRLLLALAVPALHCAADTHDARERPSGAGASDASSGGGTTNETGGDASGVGGEPSASLPDAPDAPDDEQDLVSFLGARSYSSWAKEADHHPSAGPHGNDVRVYYGPKAARALQSGAPAFPLGAAAIKELESGGSIYGWSVWVKVEDASDGGNGFFWYERTESTDGTVSVSGNGRGDRNCVGCHRAGKDFDLSTLPFE